MWLSGKALSDRTSGESAPPIKQIITPLLSARRAKTTLANEASVQALRNELQGLLAKMPASGCLKILTGGRTVASLREGKTYEPASNVKIVTAAVALEVFSKETTFTTRALGQLSNGQVQGDLYLVGGGDPLLVTNDYLKMEKNPTLSPTFLDLLADKIVAAGVKNITGTVAGDETFLSNTRFVPTWSSSSRSIEGGPLGALMVNDGVVISEPIKPSNPSKSAARELARLLIARGVTIASEPTGGATASTNSVEIASISSAPIDKILEEMLTNSDNNTAEVVLRQIGRVKSGEGSTDAGLKVVNDTLEKWGFLGSLVKDGSGLSRGSKLSCDTLTNILSQSGSESIVNRGLATAGQTGTLKDAFTDSPVAGILKGKTGTLTNIKVLSGLLPVSNREPIYFSLMLSGTGMADKGNYRPFWDSLAKALATYPARGSTAGLGVR